MRWLTGTVLLSRVSLVTALLLGVDFLDEASGVSSVGAPDIQGTFGLTYLTATLVIFVVPQLAGMLLEPPLFLLADRWPRKPFVIGGLLALAACQIVAGLSHSLPVLAGALALSYPASGCGVGLAQATLMDADPSRREELMTRWVFMGTLGDLATPLLFALLAWLDLGWREAFLATGCGIAAYALVLAQLPFPAETSAADIEPRAEDGAEDDEPDQAGLLEAMRVAVTNRRLLLWLLGCWLCSLLDEILVAFGALYLTDAFGADVGARSAVLSALMLGALVGLLATDRLLAQGSEPLRLLRGAGLLCALSYGAWLWAPNLVASAIALACVGAFSVPLYPIAKAQAYRALPGRSGAVNAASALFDPLSVALPFALGFLADEVGLVAALLVLALQPIGLFAIAATPLARRTGARE